MIIQLIVATLLVFSTFSLGIKTICFFEDENLHYYKEWKKYGKEKVESMSDEQTKE